MLRAARGFAIAFVVVGTVGLFSAGTSALPMPVRQQSSGIELASKVNGLFQVIKHRYKRHRHYRHGHSRRIRLGIHPRLCHSPEWNHVYRHHGLSHQPRHHHTPEGIHFYYDPFWQFEPWWCDDRQVTKPRFNYKRHRRHHWASRLSPKMHIRWCQERYASYSERFNTYVGHSGRRYQCNSPYDFR
jgi:hypothetical protein